jgi:hypothetical protein
VFQGRWNSLVSYSSWTRAARSFSWSSIQDSTVLPATSHPALTAARMSLVDGDEQRDDGRGGGQEEGPEGPCPVPALRDRVQVAVGEQPLQVPELVLAIPDPAR